MPGAFDRFRSDARRALQLARDECRALGHGFLGVEHVLLGLLAEGGAAAEVLAAFGVDAGDVRRRLVALEGRDEPVVDGRPGPTWECRRALELAGDEFAGTADLLAGLVREGSVARVLPRVDLGLLGGAAVEAAARPPTQPARNGYLDSLTPDVRARLERAVRRAAPELRLRLFEAARCLPDEHATVVLAELAAAWDVGIRAFHRDLAGLPTAAVAILMPAELDRRLEAAIEDAAEPAVVMLRRFGITTGG